jgi:hypothetical protein
MFRIVFTTVSLLLGCLCLPAQAAQRPSTKGQTMDYGPFLFYTVVVSKDNVANKGLVVRLSDDVCMLYDSELLRVAGAWTGGFLDLTKTNIGQLKGDENPPPKGTVAFATPMVLGWSKTAAFADPRDLKRGPLPPAAGAYKGVYIHNKRVIVAYEVFGNEVLESPGYEDGHFVRVIQILKSETPLQVLTAGDASVTLPPASKPTSHKIVYDGATAKLEACSEDLSALTHGGDARYTQTVTTMGEEGKSEGPFAIDTLTLPDDNAWGAWMRTSALDFFSDGRLAVATMNGDVWVVDGIGESLQSLTWKRYASGLYEPLGVKVVDDQVYVTCRDRIVRLKDLNNDNEADFYENFHSDSFTFDSYHDFVFDLQTDPEGNFYYVKGGNQVGWDLTDHSVVIKVSKDGKKKEYVARGFRAPNGLGVGPHGELTVGDNQGHWTPASKINWIKKDGFYGFRGDPRRKNPNHLTQTPDKMDPPLLWIPYALDNSSAAQVWIPKSSWGPLGGHMLHLSYGRGALYYVMTQDVGGTMQGAIIKYPLAFGSGMQRGAFNPKDGQLYLCGMKGWQTSGNRDGAVQRVRYTGKPLNQPLEFAATPGKITITFTDPIDPSSVDADAFAVEQWQYLWSSTYGSKDYTISDPKKIGRDPVTVKAATLSPDKKTLTLDIPELKPVMQMGIKAKLKTAAGAPLPVEIYNTINKL